MPRKPINNTSSLVSQTAYTLVAVALYDKGLKGMTSLRGTGSYIAILLWSGEKDNLHGFCSTPLIYHRAAAYELAQNRSVRLSAAKAWVLSRTLFRTFDSRMTHPLLDQVSV